MGLVCGYVRTQEDGVSGTSYPQHDDRFRHAETLHDIDPEFIEEGQAMADSNTYDPGPSFVENDQPVERLTEMPAWLQSFAAQETTREEEDRYAHQDDAGDLDAVAVDEEPVAVSTDAVLPEWLKDQGASNDAQVAEAESSNVMAFLSGFDDPRNPDVDGFISEDDLPDWLRAFSDETSGPPRSSPEITRLPAARSVPQTGGAVVRVPPVENVWLSALERQALGPGGTLFALLASNSNGAVTHSQAATASADFQQETVATERGARDQGAFSRRADVDAEGGDLVPAKQPNSMRLLLLTLFVVLLVIIVSFVLFS